MRNSEFRPCADVLTGGDAKWGALARALLLRPSCWVLSVVARRDVGAVCPSFGRRCYAASRLLRA